MTENINKSNELENRVQTLETEIKKFKKFHRKFSLIMTVLTILGISLATVISLIFRAERIAKKAKDEAVAAMVKADSAARAANSFLEEIRLMDINTIMRELNEANKHYCQISINLDTAINQYNDISGNYKRMIRQLTSSIDLCIPAEASIEGYIYYIGESNQVSIQGRDVLKQRVWITFNDSILPIIARKDTLKVKFIFSK